MLSLYIRLAGHSPSAAIAGNEYCFYMHLTTPLWSLFLIALAKTRKATISIVMSFRLSACKNSAPTGRIFMTFYVWEFFENLSKNFKFNYNLTRKISGYFTWRPICTLLSYLANFFLEWEMFQTKVLEKIKIILFLSFRRVLNVNYSFLGNSPASEF